MKKGLLLTCLLTLIAAFGMAQSQWPITFTKADGLPGVKGPLNYQFKTPQYSFEEAFQTLRFTVCATVRTDANTTAYDGYSSGWGPGNAFFELGELTVLDANGQPIDYVASTNALNTWDGSSKGTTLALNDGSFATWFRSTWYKGTCPQEYHYVDLEFAAPISVFSLEWYTSLNNINEPSYVGLTPGTVYSPYPEQNFELGAKVADVAELAEGGLFVIQDNAPSYFYGWNEWTQEDGYDRAAPTANKAFYHSPCGGVLTPGAGTVVFLKPTGEENVYNVQWLNSGRVISQQSATGWTTWSDNIADAASILFSNSENSENDGNIRMTSVDGEFTYLADALGKMAYYTNVDTVLAKRSRPFDLHFSLYKANLDVAPVKAVLNAAVADAQARVDLYGFNEAEDEGQYEAITSAIAAANALAADAPAADVLAARAAIIDALPAYVALGIYACTDSAGAIITAIEDGDITLSAAPNWVEGSYPEGSDAALRAVIDEAFIVMESNPTIAQVDAAIASVNAAIDRFWASKITGVKSLPFRVGAKEDGLPGAYLSSTGYIWESPVYLLTEEVSSLRFTVFNTNTPDRKFGDWVFFTLGEFELFDLYGNKIELTEESFDANSIDPADGSGYAALWDGRTDTWFHSVYSNSVGHNPKGFDGSVPCYLEITLPEAISGFRYKQTGRVYSGTTRVSTPVDFVFGKVGEDVTPSDVPFVDPYNAQVGEKITDVSQLTDDGIYAIQGLISCDPVNHFADDLREPRFFSGIDVYGKTAQAPCAYSIRKNTDGTYLIQSLADGKYWSKSHDGDGWCGASATQYVEQAASVHIEPMGNAGLPNSFVMYHYEDSLVRDGLVRPYLIFQDWGDNVALFSCATLEDNDKDGEGEWYIYKLTMDNAYVYWLKNLVAIAEGLGLEYRPDPGYYKDLGTFPETLAAAQAAVDVNDNAACKSLVLALDAAIDGVKDAVPNPMTEGIYVIESANSAFFENQGVYKAMCAYPNDGDDAEVDNAYKLYWGDKPSVDNYNQVDNIYKFEFISANESEQVQLWLENSIINAEQAANAYYIKSVAYNSFVGERESVSKDIPLVASQDDATVYIVRQQLPTIYDLWNPKASNYSLHMENHSGPLYSGGAGLSGHIVYYTGSDAPSLWRLRRVDYTPTPVKSYTVEVFSNGNGTVSGGGEYLSGTQATLVATPDDGYMFAGWYSGDKLISSNSVYKFVVVNSQSITARFILLANTVNLGGTIEAVPGKEVTIPVNLTNSDAITAFQFDLNLPSGVTLKSVSLASGRKTSSHSLSYSKLSNGKTRVVAYSGSNKPFVGNNGVIANITVKVSDTASLGQYSVSADNIRLIKPDATEILLNSVATKLIVNMMYGDANKDNQVTLDDVVVTVNYILERNPSNFWFAAADVNKNSEITMSDAVSIVNIILSSYLSENSFNAIRNFVTPTSDAILSMQDAQGNDGSVTVPVSLSNSEAYTAFQMDVELPEGTEFASARLSSRAALNHTLAWNQIAANKVRVVAYSIDNSNFSDNSGDIIFFDITSEKSVNGAVSVDNVRMITDEGVGSVINGCGSLIDINGTTGIGDTDSDALSVYGTDGAAIIESGKAFTASVYTAGGRLVQTVDIAEGKNRIALPAGTYIVVGVKVVVK